MDTEEKSIVIRKKKETFLEKVGIGFVSEDISIIWAETKKNVIIPGIMRTLSSTLHTLVDSFLGQSTGGYSYQSQQTQRDKRFVNYTDYYGKSTNQITEHKDYVRETNIRKDISSYLFETEEDANLTIEWMRKTLRNSPTGYLTVAEWYDHFGIKAEWTDCDSCWRDLSSARVMPNTGFEGGFYLLTPRPEKIR